MIPGPEYIAKRSVGWEESTTTKAVIRRLSTAESSSVGILVGLFTNLKSVNTPSVSLFILLVCLST